MKKILLILFLFFNSVSLVFALENVDIITREEWGADESYRYLDSPEWQKIIKNREEADKKELTQVQKNKIKKEKLMNEILVRDFYDDIELITIKREENGHTLAWPIQKTKKVKSIVIHHTYSDFTNSVKGVRSMYKYHAINRGWGDIGYNYLIGKDGEIFEGRAGGDYTVAAHNKRNNRSTIGIALIGNYSDKEINQKQYNSLKKLTKALVEKYYIDLNIQSDFHKECLGENCVLPLESYKLDSIIGHRDAGHTSCPGEKLYNQITRLKQEIKKEVKLILPIPTEEERKKIHININKSIFFKKLEKIDDYKLFKVLLKIEEVLDKERDTYKYIKIEKTKKLIIDYFKEKDGFLLSNIYKTFDENHKVKIKLSYPYNDEISIKSGDKFYKIMRDGKYLKLGKKKLLFLKIESPKDSFSEIISWDRKPAWDKENKYNDNKFRGDLILYIKNNRIVVINRLLINDYLKGLGEVSNGNNKEKIKTIIIAARSYVRWYIGEARKYEGKWYDGTDNPDEFQKYLGYEYENRSPNVVEIVENTKDTVITYEDKLIKPWYFSQSDGKTMSFYKYCINSKKPGIKIEDINFCKKESKKYPFLSVVKDPAGEGKQRYGHGVGISGAGSTYLANIGWTAPMIIKYFLKGVEVEKINTKELIVTNK